jgi:hypothetical protein
MIIVGQKIYIIFIKILKIIYIYIQKKQMNEIYKQKAEKYEYKFLKLKKQLEGGEIDHKLCKSIILTSKFQNLEVQEIYKSSRFSKKWKDYINELHTGKLLWKYPLIITKNFEII